MAAAKPQMQPPLATCAGGWRGPLPPMRLACRKTANCRNTYAASSKARIRRTTRKCCSRPGDGGNGDWRRAHGGQGRREAVWRAAISACLSAVTGAWF